MLAVLAPTAPATSSRPSTERSMLRMWRISITSSAATISAATSPIPSAMPQ